ncbi:MAG: AI-2E family transporter [Candidatus Promineofilum sp.]|nr:AI-2E family transporter [Promineifilum sp.]MCW5863658.1 AI-2E family transporter [Anaerolineae bacterium]
MLDHRPALELPELSVRQLVTATLVVGLVALSIWLAFRFHQVILILIAGVIISTALQPVVNWLQRRGLPAGAAVLLLFGVLALIVILFLRFGVPLIADQAANIGAQLGEAYSRFVERLGQSSNLLLRRLAEVIPPQFGLPADVSAAPVEGQGVEVVESPFAQVWVTLGTVAGGIYKTAAIFFVAFFWTVESDRIKRVGISLLPLNRRDPARDLITEIEGRVGGYVAGQVVVSGIIGTLSLIAYWIIGIPYAIVLALIIALMEFIPVVGPLIGAVPSIIIALSIAPSKAVWVLIVSLVIHQLEANVFGPRVMKRTLGMRPLVTLVAMTAFGTLFGILGALIALPLTAIIQMLLERFLLSTTPQTEPTGERDRVGLLRYQTMELVEDIRKVLRQRESAPADAGSGQHLEDVIETIALDLDKLLSQSRNGAEAS